VILNKKSSDKNPTGPTILERVVFIYGDGENRARSGLSWTEDVADFYMEVYPDFFEVSLGLERLPSPYDGEEWLESYWD
jgi:hypothetical protein